MIRSCNRRRGAILPLVAISTISLVAITGLVIDGGLLLKERRLAQNAADCAAMAASQEMLYGTGATAAAKTAFEYAKDNGYDTSSQSGSWAANTTLTVGNATVTVNIPPKSGPNTGKPNAVEVIVSRKLQTVFMAIVGSTSSTAAARAVAISTRGSLSILILHPTEEGALEIRGNVTVQSGGQIYSNSNNTTSNDAASQGATGSIFIGSNAQVQATGVNVFNTVVVQGGSNLSFVNADGSPNSSGKTSTYTALQPDPLQSVPDPTTNGLTSQGSKTFTTNGSYTLNPGKYNTITIGSQTQQPTVTMNPGLYWVNTAFNMWNGTLNGTGVMIVNNTAGNDEVFGWSNPAFSNSNYYGTGSINVSPPSVNSDGTNSGGSWPTGTTAGTYNGISMWIPRTEDASNNGGTIPEFHFQSSQNVTMLGTFYAQGAEYDIRANSNPSGTLPTFTVGGYIASLGEWNQKYGGDNYTGLGTIVINPGQAALTATALVE